MPSESLFLLFPIFGFYTIFAYTCTLSDASISLVVLANQTRMFGAGIFTNSFPYRKNTCRNISHAFFACGNGILPKQHPKHPNIWPEDHFVVHQGQLKLLEHSTNDTCVWRRAESIGMAQNSAVTTQIWWLTSQSIKMAMLMLIWWLIWWYFWWLIWWLSILICIKMAMLGLVPVFYPYFQTKTFKPWFSKAALLFWSPWSKQ
jgi:hypothetical protein